MLSATLASTKRVSLQGLKYQWKIIKDDEMASCGGMEYIKICPRNYSLAKLISEKNSNLPEDDKDDVVNLTRSIGIAKILRLRNQLQASSFMEIVAQPSCTLFAPPPDKRVRVVHARREQGELRKNPQTLVISLTAAGSTLDINVLRSVHPQDNIFVAYEPHMLAHVLCFIREEGFTEKKEKRADLPEGIHRRGDKFIARYVKTQGDHNKKQQFGC